ncbi:MAG: hypothetical protein AABM42_10600 [Actinomycetota bacterium]
MRRKLPLFDDKARTDPEPSYARESTYAFLDRVDDPIFVAVREVLNAWVDRFASLQDDTAANDLVGRLRSKDDIAFYAAFWELYLHELFVRLGFNIEVHPESGKDTRPDFRMTREGREMYLEAVMPNPRAGRSNESKGSKTVIEYIDAAFDPDFSLSVRFVAGSGSVPSKKEVVRGVEGWLANLTWTEPSEAGLDPRSPRPETELRVRDWVIGVRAWPRPLDRRGDRKFPMIVTYPAMSGYPAAVSAGITPVLDEKASKYGDLKAPYILAVWVMSAMASESTPAEALFGIALPIGDGTHSTGLPLTVDERDGLWAPTRPGRLSAVLSANSMHFNYSAVSRYLPRIWHNPWALHPANEDLPFGASRVSQDETSITNDPPTASPSALFELPADWPGDPFACLNRRKAAS